MLLKIIFSLLIGLILIVTIITITQSHYNDNNKNRFKNLDPKCKPKKLIDVLKWRLTTKHTVWPKYIKVNSYDVPPLIVTDSNKVRVSFVGHVTFLIQTNGLNILTDPVWSERASPFSFIGPKRVIAPGIKIEDLPKIDIILISHNHYDHMDLATINILWQRDHPKIITPLLNDVIIKNKIKGINVTVLNWYDQVTLDSNTKINLEPSQHWSARGLFDLNQALWGNFIITTPAGAICFIGDSGYSEELYKQIGMKYKILLSLIPIGAFEPRWFMQDVHMNPQEAVLVHQYLKSVYSIGSHFQTFPLASDSYYQAVDELNIALNKYHISSEKFITPKVGQVYWFTKID